MWIVRRQPNAHDTPPLGSKGRALMKDGPGTLAHCGNAAEVPVPGGVPGTQRPHDDALMGVVERLEVARALPVAAVLGRKVQDLGGPASKRRRSICAT